MPPPVDYATLPTTTQEAMRLIQPAMRNAKDGKAVEAVKGFLEAGRVLCATLEKGEPNVVKKLHSACAEQDIKISNLESELAVANGKVAASKASDSSRNKANQSLVAQMLRKTSMLRSGLLARGEEVRVMEDMVKKKDLQICAKDLEIHAVRETLTTRSRELSEAKTYAERPGLEVVLTQAGYAPTLYCIRSSKTLAVHLSHYAEWTRQDVHTFMARRIWQGAKFGSEVVDPNNEVLDPKPPSLTSICQAANDGGVRTGRYEEVQKLATGLLMRKETTLQ
ncbi:hypothetical protein LTR17_017187 [Elasticomyces elasticus]|nr:hypothetical protein LTR17_017187 [Elasticomyces elasticus]